MAIYPDMLPKAKSRLIELNPAVEKEYEEVLKLCLEQNPRLSIRILDAIHIASANTSLETEVVTTDKLMREIGKFLGFGLFPV